MREGYWVIRTYEAGAVGEKIKFWVPGRKPTKSERRLKTEAAKALSNESSAVKRLARILNANYGKGDVLLGLDYSAEGYAKLISAIDGWDELGEVEQLEALRREAEHQAKLCLRRVKYALKKQGIEAKTVLVTSDMDGETGEHVRVHHHLVINREAAEAFTEKWSLGGVEREPMSGQKDYKPIAEYLLKQVRKIPDAKKYTPSRNLVQPQPKDRIVAGGSLMRPPKGAVVLQFDVRTAWQPQYLRYILPAAADLGGTVYGRKRRETETPADLE